MVAITAEYRRCRPGELVTIYCGHRCAGHTGEFVRTLRVFGRECVEIVEQPGRPPLRFQADSIVGVIREAIPRLRQAT
jgi:hypothetical protein